MPAAMEHPPGRTYFFHLRKGSRVLNDPEGVVCADSEAAIAVALKSARAILSADICEGVVDLDQEILVTSECDQLIGSVPFAQAVHFRGAE